MVDCDTNIRTVAMPDYDEEMLHCRKRMRAPWYTGIVELVVGDTGFNLLRHAVDAESQNGLSAKSIN